MVVTREGVKAKVEGDPALRYRRSWGCLADWAYWRKGGPSCLATRRAGLNHADRERLETLSH